MPTPKPKRLHVAMYTKDGYGPRQNPMPDDWQTRLKLFKENAEKAFALQRKAKPKAAPVWVSAVPSGSGRAPAPPPPPPEALKPEEILNVFIAPEYFFRKDMKRAEKDGTITAYTEAEKKEICKGLATYSKSRKNFLVVGGSIFWIPDKRKDGKPNSIANRGLEKVEVRHTVHAFYNGQELLEYGKRHDAHELSDAESKDGYVYVPGTKLGKFMCGAVSCGIETCVDHEQKEMAKGGPLLELHIIVSNTVAMNHPAAHKNGYVLHCDANQAERLFISGVYGWPHKPANRIEPDAKEGVLHSFYALDFPAQPAG